MVITCNLMGGLGNQLFQVFATIAYAMEYNTSFMFLNVQTLGGGSTTMRHTYWNTFFSKLKPCLVNYIPNLHTTIKEHNFAFNKLPFYTENCLLDGYFQSYKYFCEYYDVIHQLIDVEQMKCNLEFDGTNFISMHFRLGDYKKIQEVHPLTTYDYYKNALHFIQNNRSELYNVLYFCEDEDIDEVMTTIVRLEKEFPTYTFIRGNNTLEDWEQMLLMSCCHHNIIANSSFSWWSAYFNNWTDKIVCYPSVWFGQIANHDTKDLCPPDWTKITTIQTVV